MNLSAVSLCRSVGLHRAGVGRVHLVSQQEGLVLRSLGPHGAAVRLLRPPQSTVQHGAGPMDHRLPQVRKPSWKHKHKT